MTVWDSLIGQEEPLQLFRDAAVAAGETPAGPAMTHAWLVTGPPGSGRSVVARSFAAALVCAATASARVLAWLLETWAA